MEALFNQIPPDMLAVGIAAVAFLAVAGLVCLPIVLLQTRKLSRLETEGSHTGSAAGLWREVAERAPDGLFVWDLKRRVEVCNTRLAAMLHLPSGTGSRFSDIEVSLGADAGKRLAQAARELRDKATGFDVTLGGPRGPLRARGVRAWGPGGEALADVLWFTGAAAAPAGDSDAGDDPRNEGAEYLRTMLDALPVPLWLRDKNLALAFKNRACHDEALGEPPRAVAEQAIDAGHAVSARQALSESAAASLYEITETPVPGWAGTVGMALAVAGEAAAPADGLGSMADLIDSLATAIAVFGPDHRLLHANKAYAVLWGLERAWLAEGPRYMDILDRLRARRLLPETRDLKAFREAEAGLLEATAPPPPDLLHLPDGRAVRRSVLIRPGGGHGFIFEDVSSRLQLERAYKELVAVQKATLDNLFEGLAVFGADGRLKLVNPMFLELWNLDADGFPEGTHIAALLAVIDGFFAAPDGPAADEGQRIGRLMSRQGDEDRLLRNDGVVLDYAAVPLPDGATLLSYIDVTDAAVVEDSLRARADALDEASRLKSEFIANLSHEVRTPLTTISGYAQALSADYAGKLNHRQRDYTDGITRAGERLIKVVAEILELSAIEAGTMALDLDTFDLHHALVAVMELVRDRARRKSLQLEFDCPADIGRIVADQARLKQVVLNLLGNAIDFSPDHRLVTLSAERTANGVTIKVADTGLGIPRADQERVLEPFQRGAGPERRGDGPGLGLTLVQRFIELHGGTVEVRSAPNQGTTVICRIPAEVAD